MADPVEQFLNRLQHPVIAGIDMKLDRVLRLMSALGNPQKKLPPVIHVAGTNGKGSLIAYLQAIFEAAGYKVHRYTSPHLVHFNERILLAGQPIDNATLEPILKHVAAMLPQYPATFFEATMAIACLAYNERKADVLLLETGMGGRLDATNIIDKPMLTAITPISFDHMEYLGKTIAAIAGEKAGIIKRDVPCVVGRQMQEAAGVIARKAAEMNAPLYRLGQEWQVEWQGEQAFYVSQARRVALHPALIGKHQFDNAATAVACIDHITPHYMISDAHIAQGLASAVWPARLQHLTQGRFVRPLPPGFELWLDGGHNPQGGEVLAEWMRTRLTPPSIGGRPGGGQSCLVGSMEQGRPHPNLSMVKKRHPDVVFSTIEPTGEGIREIYAICGMLGNKDATGYLQAIAPHVKVLYAIAIPNEPQTKPADQLAAAAKAAGIEAHAMPGIEKALQTIVSRATTPCIICICGSLYLAGKVLAANE